jgi:geranylgeranyl pyrophosphate synthase
VRGKTASLISCACVVGTQWGKPDLSESEQQTVLDAGMLMGQAFQLVDDLLDVFGDEAEVGKPLWNDIKGGWLSLPMIRLVDHKPDFAPILIDAEQSAARKDEIQITLAELNLYQV